MANRIGEKHMRFWKYKAKKPTRGGGGQEDLTPLHAHEITPDDAALIRMMAGASFGPNARVTLPSGKTITGDEMARWVEQNPE